MDVWKSRSEQATREDRGVWFASTAQPGWRFKLRRDCDWNEHTARAKAAIVLDPTVRDYIERANSPGYEPTGADKNIDQAIILRSFVAGCVVEWDGVTGPDGGAFPFGTLNGFKLLQHFPDVRAELQRAASTAALFAKPVLSDRKQAAVKNSKPAQGTCAGNGRASQGNAVTAENGASAPPA